MRLLRRAPGREVPETVPKAEAAPSGPAQQRTPARVRRLKEVSGDRAAPTPALAGSQHHRESDEHRDGMFRCPHLSPLYSGRESAHEPSLSTEATAERKGRRLRGGGRGSRWGPRGTEEPPGPGRRNSRTPVKADSGHANVLASH